MSSGPPAIETNGLTKRYGAVTAVHDFDLTVERGEVFGFLGPNGAGKSTTIDVLLDFVRPTSGRASVLGVDPQADPRTVRRRTGVLPENYGLYDRLSGRAHVEFAAEMGGVDDADSVDDDADGAVDAILDRVGLGGDADRTVGGYSKGMRQRLALGMALVGDPELLILDEPSSGLDPNGAREVQEIVREKADRGDTVFFSSHILGQVEAVCDRVGILDDGELLAVDDVDALIEAAGGESTLVLAVDEVPADPGLAGLDGVSEVTEADGSLRVACTDPGVKADAISRVEEAGATVTDISVEEASLDALFAEYTRGADG